MRPDGKWLFQAPRASLFDDERNLVAEHFSGPTWQAADGSIVVGRQSANATTAAFTRRCCADGGTLTLVALCQFPRSWRFSLLDPCCRINDNLFGRILLALACALCGSRSGRLIRGM